MTEESGITLSLTAEQAALASLAVGLLAGGFGGFVSGTAVASPTGQFSATEPVNESSSGSGESGPTRVALDGIELEGEPSRGPEDASVKVVQYNEFGCPFCAEWAGVDASPRVPIDSRNTEQKFMEQYVETGEVEFVQKNMVQPRLHPNSVKGHRIANCVYDNAPDSYWEFQNQLFERRDSWMRNGQNKPEETFRNITSDLGLDTQQMISCYSSSDGEEARQDSTAIARQVERVGTPTFFIGNREDGFVKVSGAQPLSRLEQEIQKFKG
jgi:protein-disulfide isomerase